MRLKSLEKSVSEMIEELFPKVLKEKKYGGVLYQLPGADDSFCGVFAYKNHVSLEFGEGYRLSDPGNILQGKGKYRRHLKFTDIDEAKRPVVKKFLKEAAKLSRNPFG